MGDQEGRRVRFDGMARLEDPVAKPADQASALVTLTGLLSSPGASLDWARGGQVQRSGRRDVRRVADGLAHRWVGPASVTDRVLSE